MKANSFLILAAATIVCACESSAQTITQTEKFIPPPLEKRLTDFFTEKEAQAHLLAVREDHEQAPEIWDFFEAGRNADWDTVAEIYGKLRRGAYQYQGTDKDARLVTMVWQPVNESYGAYAECVDGQEPYVSNFGQGILNSLPRGSIYFGGTDPGRWLVTAFSKSHPKADPCFVLTQNALADALYMKYLRAMYGSRIQVPREEETKKAFDEYVAEATRRLESGKLKPGEIVEDMDGKVQVSGQVAVMEVNARIAKRIFEKNPRREFFVEESFPLEWMYPHLSPHGLIMKIERKPLTELTDDLVKKDRTYWTRFTDRTLGQWLTPETPLNDVCEFATKIFESKEMGSFKGDPNFVRNANACKTYSKLRSSIGGVYAWRAANSTSARERRRMAKEADFAFRQAFALCPYSPEAVHRYAQLLRKQGRNNDAELLLMR